MIDIFISVLNENWKIIVKMLLATDYCNIHTDIHRQLAVIGIDVVWDDFSVKILNAISLGLILYNTSNFTVKN